MASSTHDRPRLAAAALESDGTGRLLTPAEYAQLHSITAERVRQLCRRGRIIGAIRKARGASSVWLIPESAPVTSVATSPPLPRLREDANECLQLLMPRISLFQPDKKYLASASKRLAVGRQEAGLIIQEMAAAGVQILLFGSMRTGHTTPYSDIDLLITDPGSMSVERAVAAVLGLQKSVPVDVVPAAYMRQDTLMRILASCGE